MVKVMEGFRVLELAQFTFVPAAGAILADRGADVLKIEHPRGDPAHTPYFADLLTHVRESGPWSLVVVDPLSRFAGAEAETGQH